jgi:copper homeostasis protein
MESGASLWENSFQEGNLSMILSRGEDKMVTCEVCVEGFSGAYAAAQGGAHRVELCAGLLEGGTTPSQGNLTLSLEELDIPVMVLVRPRGGDFLYSPREVDTILRDISLAGQAGAHGVVTGALTKGGEVDLEVMAKVREAAGSMSLTFHRAFDMVRQPLQALESLVELGVDRILTSGGEASVPEALDQIGRLVEAAGDRIFIMPGGGVRGDNIQEVVRRTGVREIHFTAFTHWESPMEFRNSRPHMGGTRLPGEYDRVDTDPTEVRRIMEALQG